MEEGRLAGIRQLELLARLARIATEDVELAPMLQRITDALVEELGWEFVAFVRVDRDRRCFVCEACTSRLPTEIRPGYSRPFGSGVVGHVAESGQPLLLDDTSTFHGFVDTLGGARSELCMPIRHRGEVVGVLNLESPRAAAFHDDLPLVEAIAGQIAGAIASARALEAARRNAAIFATLSAVSREALDADDLDQALDRIASFLRQRFDFHLVAIVVADEGDSEWTHRALAQRGTESLNLPERWPVERGVVGRAVRTGRQQYVADVTADSDYFAIDERVVGELVEPILCDGRALGAINVESDRHGVLTDEVRSLMTLVAEQISGAVRLSLAHRGLTEATRQLAEANAKLERLSLIDPLTGVANRRRFDAALDLEWRRQARARRPLALVLMDLDAFKAYNDALGHPAGDRCLRRVGELLAANVQRAGDLAARFGGEEFAVLLHEADVEAARETAERLRSALRALSLPHPASSGRGVVTASFGVAATTPAVGDDPERLVAAADAALYAAKRAGRDRVEEGTPRAR